MPQGLKSFFSLGFRLLVNQSLIRRHQSSPNVRLSSTKRQLSILASTLVALTLTLALCALLLVGRPLPSAETPIKRWAHQVYRPLLNVAIQAPKLILGISLAGFMAVMVILPGLGKVFLPEFQDRALVNAVTLFPGQSLEATNQSAIAVMDALKNDQRFDSIQFRSGFASGDPDVGGVNFGELDVQISAEGSIDREKTVAVLRQELEKLPGVASSVGGFISHRMDEILSGVRLSGTENSCIAYPA
jgi:Cu/Ag efflux pump CusA